MLQIATSRTSQPPVFSARMSRKSATPKNRSHGSALEKIIAEHKAAAQIARARQRAEDRIYATHLDLLEPWPKDVQAKRDRRRRELAVGLVAVRNEAYRASMAEKIIFNRLVKTVPSTRSEIGRYARYVSLVIKHRVGGNHNPSVGSGAIEKMGGMQAFEYRVLQAHDELYKVLLALAKRPRGRA